MGMLAPNTSFLLRLWHVPFEEQQGCRVLLENIRTGEKLGFASLEDLGGYLQQVLVRENNKPIRMNNELQGRGENHAT